MKFSPSEVTQAAEATGFRAEMVEKVLLLLDLLNALNSHPFLKGKWVLKGGTALNMFMLDLLRLSVDIDLNYVGVLDREVMLEERPKIEQAAQAVFSREGFSTKRIPGEHAGGKWRLSYQSFTGQSGNLEVDMNYMFRQPLWDIRTIDSHQLGGFRSKRIPILDIHELAAGKLAALLAQGTLLWKIIGLEVFVEWKRDRRKSRPLRHPQSICLRFFLRCRSPRCSFFPAYRCPWSNEVPRNAILSTSRPL